MYKNEPYNYVDTVTYDIEDFHFKRRIIESNKFMINECYAIICFVDENKYQSGAKIAMRYAKKQGLKIVNIFDETDRFY